jgi:hypothetical protein
MQRCNLEFVVSVKAEVYRPMFLGVKKALERDPLSKVLLHINTQASAEDVLLKESENILLSITGGGDTLTLTGSTGLMMKNWIVNLFGEWLGSFSQWHLNAQNSPSNCK